MQTLSIRLHLDYNSRLLETVVGCLESAIISYPDTFDRVQDKPNTVDHYGYHDNVRSAVLLSRDHNSRFYTLRIIDVDHPVLNNIAHLIASTLLSERE